MVARAAAGQTTLSSGYSDVGFHWWKVPGLQPSDRVLSPCSYAARVPIGLWQVLVASTHSKPDSAEAGRLRSQDRTRWFLQPALTFCSPRQAIGTAQVAQETQGQYNNFPFLSIPGGP